jgi:enterochelin esterase-like enzyme
MRRSADPKEVRTQAARDLQPLIRLAVTCSIAILLGACDVGPDSDSRHEVEMAVYVPDGTPTVYLTGNIDPLGPWAADALVMTGDGNERRATIRVPDGHVLEYKFTLGSWAREEVGPTNLVKPNYSLPVKSDQSVRHEIVAFKREPADYMTDWQNSGVSGTLVYWQDVSSDFLSETRHVEVWLPPGYDRDRQKRYRVIYMHDGQNLFDPRIANTGIDWGVDEAMMRGAGAGLFDPAIVVGAWSTERRFAEYSPWHNASQYARFLVEELMPRVNAEFRTLTGPQHTSAMGSSMGGLLSFYLVKTHPDVFGACGCVSSHFPLSAEVAASFPGAAARDTDATPYVLRDIAGGATVPDDVRFFFDYGTETLDASYGPTHAALRDWLLAQGKVEGKDFRIQEYPGAAHNEAAWRARLDDQLAWLLHN